MCEALAVSERRACRVLGQVRRTQRYTSILSDDETVLVAHVVSLATEYGRYGYRRIIHALNLIIYYVYISFFSLIFLMYWLFH